MEEQNENSILNDFEELRKYREQKNEELKNLSEEQLEDYLINLQDKCLDHAKQQGIKIVENKNLFNSNKSEN